MMFPDPRIGGLAIIFTPITEHRSRRELGYTIRVSQITDVDPGRVVLDSYRDGGAITVDRATGLRDHGRGAFAVSADQPIADALRSHPHYTWGDPVWPSIEKPRP